VPAGPATPAGRRLCREGFALYKFLTNGAYSEKDPIPHAEKNYRVPANRETRRTGVEVWMNENAAQ
jgi:hypothetical protein